MNIHKRASKQQEPPPPTSQQQLDCETSLYVISSFSVEFVSWIAVTWIHNIFIQNTLPLFLWLISHCLIAYLNNWIKSYCSVYACSCECSRLQKVTSKRSRPGEIIPNKVQMKNNRIVSNLLCTVLDIYMYVCMWNFFARNISGVNFSRMLIDCIRMK